MVFSASSTIVSERKRKTAMQLFDQDGKMESRENSKPDLVHTQKWNVQVTSLYTLYQVIVRKSKIQQSQRWTKYSNRFLNYHFTEATVWKSSNKNVLKIWWEMTKLKRRRRQRCFSNILKYTDFPSQHVIFIYLYIYSYLKLLRIYITE